MMKEIDAGAEELRQYYERNNQDYRDRNGQIETYEKAKQEVYRDYYSSAMTRKLFLKISALKKEYKIAVFEEALNALRVDVENDPTAVEFYTGKTGGIFPRPA